MKDVKTLREESLDPADWEPLRALALRIVDDAVDEVRRQGAVLNGDRRS